MTTEKTKKITARELAEIMFVDRVKRGVPKFLKNKGMLRSQAEKIEKAEDGNTLYTVGTEYYYRHNRTAEGFAKRLEKLIAGSSIVDGNVSVVTYGDHFSSFTGGAGALTARSSYFWAVIAVAKTTKRPRPEAKSTTPAGSKGPKAQEDKMTTYSKQDIEWATELAKTIRNDESGRFRASLKVQAKKMLGGPGPWKQRILGDWIRKVASMLGLENCEETTLAELKDHILFGGSSAEKEQAEPEGPGADEETGEAEGLGEKVLEEGGEAEEMEEAEEAEETEETEGGDAGQAPHVSPARAEPKKPVSIQAVVEAISQQEGRHLGDLCGWSLSGSRRKDEVEAVADRFGLTDDLSFPKLTPNACYRKAISQIFTVGKSDRNGRPMARLVEDSADKIVHSIVSSRVVDDEDNTVSAKDVEFVTDFKVGFDKRAYRDGASPSACLVLEDPTHPAAEQLRAEYLELAETYLSYDIRNAFQAAFRAWDACPILPHGGLWYIPAVHAEKVRAWNGFMAALSLTTVVIPTFDTAETIESLREATLNSLEGQLADLQRHIDGYIQEGWATVRTNTIEKRVQEFDELRARAELYQAILGTTVEDLSASVSAAAERLTRDLTQRRQSEQEAAEAEAERKAEEKAERKEARKAARAAAKAEAQGGAQGDVPQARHGRRAAQTA